MIASSIISLPCNPSRLPRAERRRIIRGQFPRRTLPPVRRSRSHWRWRLEMPKENNAFDFETISDVILHLKYTAREGGDPLRQAARQALATGPQSDLVRLISRMS